jgi:gamma-glutamyltranspeptidase/glutathione hydrolase
LRLIAADGADAFYRGPIAAAIADAIARDGGVLNQDDLAGYQLREVQPLRFRALGREILTMPPPSSGGVAIAQMLSMLDQTIPSPDADAWNTAPVIHRRVEIMRHAFADRAHWMGDPAFVDVPVQRMISPDYVAAMSNRIGPTTQPIDSYGGQPGRGTTQVPTDGGTSHFSVVDARGNAVACTETINLIFGSCLAVEKYGFVLNNEMDDFTTRRGQPNAFKLVQSDQNLPEPGKRPLSSMSPTIVLDSAGRVEVVVGASGGPRIITGTMQVLSNVLLFDLPAGEALRRPRVHHQWQPDVLHVEAGALEIGGESAGDAKAGLRNLGYTIEKTESVGNVQLIRRSRDGRRWDAASDPRKGGRPAGL